MARKEWACILFGLSLGACGVGDSGGGGTSPDATSDDPDVLLGVTCRASLKLTGTMAPGTPTRPINPDTAMPMTGCWPVGTWTFTATVDAAATAAQTHPCTTPPTVLPSYSFRVDRTDLDGTGLVESYTYLGDMAMLYRMHVSSGGGGECEGGLELYSIDNKQYWNLQPELTGTAIAGSADYAVFKDAQLRK